MITEYEPKLQKGGILTVYKAGHVNKHGPTPPRPYALKYEMQIPGEDKPERVTLQTRTHLVSAAAEYVRLTVRATEPEHLGWEPGTEEVMCAYNKLEAQ